MGLNINATKLLLKLKSEEFQCGRVLTLGSQRLNLPKRALQKNLNAFGYRVDGAELKKRNNGYCEPFLELLGAQEVHSMDVSDYEKASLLHDLNEPIPDAHISLYHSKKNIERANIPDHATAK